MPKALSSYTRLERAVSEINLATEIKPDSVSGRPRTYLIQRRRSHLLKARDHARAAKRKSLNPSQAEIERADRILDMVNNLWPSAQRK